MSRVGKQPVLVPQGVEVKIGKEEILVSGPKGKLVEKMRSEIAMEMKDGKIVVTRSGDDNRMRALHGTLRSLLQNMMDGVSKGFTKSLEIQGVGFRAKVEGKMLEMQLGFTHPTRFAIPEGITVDVEKNVLLHVRGADKRLVGEVAAKIRRFYPPEPYKGKGIRYVGEHVRRKAGKAVA